MFDNTLPVTVSLPHPLLFLRCPPVPLPFPLPSLCSLPFPLPILCSLAFAGPPLTTLRVLLTFTVVIFIRIAMTAPTTARRIGICSRLIVMILVDYLIPIERSNCQEVAWRVLPAARRLNLCPPMIATVPIPTLAGEFILPQAGCLQIGVINLIPKVTGVDPPPIVHWVTGFVNNLPHIGAECCPALPHRPTPASELQPHQLELWKVASHDWIRKDYFIKEVPCLLILDAASIVYLYESTDQCRVVFATGLGNLPADRVRTANMGCFGSSLVRQRGLLPPGGPNPDPYP